MNINPNVTSLNKRTVWKIFDREGDTTGKIVSLFQAASYPLGKRITRSPGIANNGGYGGHGLHFYVTKSLAKKHASFWMNAYIAKFKVNPKDFMFASVCGEEAMYESATRVGKYIRVN